MDESRGSFDADFRDTLTDVDMLIGFKAFLDKSLCPENLYFWIEVEIFRTRDSGSIERRADEIYQKYFGIDSLYQINLPGNITEELQNEMKESITPTIFDKAQRAVFKIMEEDSWFRYKKSDMYIIFMKGLEQRRKRIKVPVPEAVAEDRRQQFFQSIYNGVADSWASKKKKMFSASTSELQGLIKQYNVSQPIRHTNWIRQEDLSDVTLAIDNLLKPKTNINESDDDNSDVDTDDSDEEDGTSLIKMGILSSLLVPIHGILGPLTVKVDPSDQKEFHQSFKDIIKDVNKLFLVQCHFCVYKGKGSTLFQGKLYLTEKFWCFYSVGPTNRNKVVSWTEVVHIEKSHTFKTVPNIRIRLVSGNKVVLHSFINRDPCYDNMMSLWTAYINKSKLNKGTVRDQSMIFSKQLSNII